MLNNPSWSRAVRTVAAACALIGASASWAAPAVTFVATDLTDVTAGQDLWSYSYTVNGPVDAFGGLTLSYQYGVYDNLVIGIADPEVDTSTAPLQPDAVFGLGNVTVTWTSDLLAGASSHFDVDFTWLGTGTPGSQAFTMFDANGAPTVEGVTSTAGGGTVPEPSALLLVSAALAAAGLARRANTGA